MAFSVIELQVLAGLAEGKTLSEIGNDLFLRQPAVTRALLGATQRAGLQLTEKRGRRVQLTAAGREIAEAAKAAIQQLNDVDALTADLREGRNAVLHIVASHTPSSYLLPEVVTAMLEELPAARAIQVVIKAMDSSDVMKAFHTGQYDLAILPDYVIPRGWPREELYQDSLTFFVGPRSRFQRTPRVLWETISQEIFVGPFFQSHWYDLWPRLQQQGFAPVRSVEVASLEAVKRVVEGGNGIGMLYGSAVRKEIGEGQLVVLEVQDLSLSISYALVRRPLTRPLPVLELFIDLLLKHCRAL